MDSNCPNCGAPISLHSFCCPYCGTPYGTENNPFNSELKRRIEEMEAKAKQIRINSIMIELMRKIEK